jgi:hypothetical protein
MGSKKPGPNDGSILPKPYGVDVYSMTERQMRKTINSSRCTTRWAQCPNQPMHHQLKLCNICGNRL